MAAHGSISPPPSEAPWKHSRRLWHVDLTTEAKDSRRLPPASRKQAGEATLQRHIASAKWVLFTDGAAHQRIGSGSAVLICPNVNILPSDGGGDHAAPPLPSTINSLVASQDRLIISRSNAANSQAFDAEVVAVTMAANWLINEGGSEPAVIACDNAALLSSIQRPFNHSVSIIKLCERLTTCQRPTTLVWVPSGSPGNIEADAAARAARGEQHGPAAALSFSAAKAIIHSTITDPHPLNQGVRTNYSSILQNPIRHSSRELINTSSEAASNRAEEVLLRQIRTGHCHKFAAFRAVMDPSVDPTCPRCHDGLDTNLHWLLDCRAIADERRIAFGGMAPDIAALVDRPAAVSSLARLTLQ